jgi:formylglycine-generating enzyme required for sulfatase activity
MLETLFTPIGMELVLIPPGSFKMGGDKNLEQAEDHETPRRRVHISKTFYMGKYAVTQQIHEVEGIIHFFRDYPNMLGLIK